MKDGCVVPMSSDLELTQCGESLFFYCQVKNAFKNAKIYKAMAYQNKEAQVLPEKKSPMQASEATSS